MVLDSLSKQIIGAAINVHKELGPGLLESAYKQCLKHELISLGLNVTQEKHLPISYKGLEIDHGYRIDLLVKDKIVIELKTVDTFADVHYAQILTYLKLGNYPVGLLINFHTKLLKDGIKRFVNSPP